MTVPTPDELNRVTDLLAGLPDFTDAGGRGRRLLLTAAGLSQFISGVDLAGAPSVVAADIVDRVAGYGPLTTPGRENYTALGALLASLERLVIGLPQDDRAFVAALIVRHTLVADAHYLDRLQKQYQLPSGSVPGPAFGPGPTTSAPLSSAPTFTPAVTDVPELERVLHNEDNFLDVYALSGAIYTAQAVCRIETVGKDAIGTGFLIGPNTLLTNQHVIPDPKNVAVTQARFDYFLDPGGLTAPGRVVQFVPDFYIESSAVDLDYAIVRLVDAPLAARAALFQPDMTPWAALLAGAHRGFLVLNPRSIAEHERVNIVQHPAGEPMKVVLTQNRVSHLPNGNRVQYVADTKPGSSGSPVCDRDWSVIALHHSGAPHPPESVADKLKKAWKGVFRVNEGVTIKAIVADLEKRRLNY